MPLKLSLKPGETFVVNGAVVRNGDRRGVLLLENRARVLREKDILHPEDAQTPAERAYFAVMQLYLLGAQSGPVHEAAVATLADLLQHAQAPDVRDRIIDISASIAAGESYRALTTCRKLMQGQAETEASAA
ncbi:MAG: flagellar biosynthesis repressor FlbT [Pseudomonadota bacterium]